MLPARNNIGTGQKLSQKFEVPLSEVNACGAVSTKELMAGEHTWKAQYRDVVIGSGTFKIKEISELKISRREVLLKQR
ncbi:MAG: hypothetical protein J5U19_11755 [Candidatus Methanoperedens sp.]|nr:hypothetical protein [Candidatus Methanoperedens sp.]